MGLRTSMWSIISGLLLGVWLVEPALWWCSLLGVAAFLQAMSTASTWRRAALVGWLAWSIKSALAISWFWYTYPLSWLDVPTGISQLAIIAFYWLSVSVTLGTGGVLVGTAVWKLLRQRSWWRVAIGVAAVWVLGEVLSALIFSMVNIGPGGVLNTHFSFGMIGYALASHAALITVAAIGGVYILSFLTIALGSSVWFWYKKQSIGVVVGLVLLASTATVQLPTVSVNGAVVSVAVVDTFFTSDVLQGAGGTELRQTELHAALATLASTSLSAVVLPEDTRFFSGGESPALQAAALSFLHPNLADAVVVDSGRTESETGALLEAAILDGQSEIIYQPSKAYLVPQGEYLPYSYGLLLRALGLRAVIDTYETAKMYRLGDTQFTAPDYVPSVLFCFESVAPTGVRTLLAQRPNAPFIAHPISHAWFHEPTILWEQLDAMLRVQAVWNDIAIVSAGNMATGKLYLPNGAVVTPQPLASGQYWRVGLVEVPVRQ